MNPSPYTEAGTLSLAPSQEDHGRRSVAPDSGSRSSFLFFGQGQTTRPPDQDPDHPSHLTSEVRGLKNGFEDRKQGGADITSFMYRCVQVRETHAELAGPNEEWVRPTETTKLNSIFRHCVQPWRPATTMGYWTGYVPGVHRISYGFSPGDGRLMRKKKGPASSRGLMYALVCNFFCPTQSAGRLLVTSP